MGPSKEKVCALKACKGYLPWVLASSCVDLSN